MRNGELGRVYADGEIICTEGEQADVMYVIQSGKVSITKKTSSGDLFITTFSRGEIFGEMALFDRLPRSATAKASGDARVLSIDKKKLFSTIDRDPTLVFKILESMSHRIRRLDENLATLKKTKLTLSQVCIGVDQTCALILEEAKNIIKADNASVMLLDDGNSLSIKAAFGAEASSKTKITTGEGIAGDVLRTGRAELINSVSLDSRFIPGGTHIASMLCAPLRSEDHTFGVINMSHSSEKLFTLEDLRVLRSLAVYASIAIQNARNYSNLHHATEDVLLHASMLDMF